MAGPRRLDTKLIHSGEASPRLGGAVVLPIFQSAMFELSADAGGPEIKYIRLSNTPSHQALHEKLAALEGAEAALVSSSGMASISASLLTVLSRGDHVLFHNTLYGGTHGLIHHELPSFGIEVGFIDAGDPGSWEAKLRPGTKAIYVESMTNPLLEVGDLEAVVAFAREHGLVSMIDNTFASPVNFRPLEIGFDLSIHSATKYLNGHSDLVAGAVAGSKSLVRRISQRLAHLGGCLDPHACFLLHRGMKTLALRMARHNENGQAIAEFLEAHPGILKVSYPGLASHRDHLRARRLFSGFGGVLSFEIDGGVEAADRFLGKLELAAIAPSLGGVETLATRPVTSSHAGLRSSERLAAGISESLVRLSVGIEAVEDLLTDLEQALAHALRG